MEGLEDGEEEELAAKEEDERGARHGAEADEGFLGRGANDELDLSRASYSAIEEGPCVGRCSIHQADPISGRIADMEEIKAVPLPANRPQLLFLPQ